MAYNDSYLSRLKKIITDPKKNAKKIIPFIKSRVEPYRRSFVEGMGITSGSKPYMGHDELVKYINFKDGFFVECGGNDGYGNDPTYYLEKILKWKGVIIEPLPIYKFCQKTRPHSKVYNTGVGSFEQRGTSLTFVDVHAMSFIKGSIENEAEWIAAGERTQQIKAKEVTIPLQPIQDVIDEHFKTHEKRSIDFFVADVEGYELNVLQGLDFTKNSPTFILLEIHTEERRKAIEEYLNKFNYKILAIIGHNDYLFKINK